MFNPNDQDSPEDTRKVFISTGDDSDWLFLWDAITAEQLSERPEKNRHNLTELATSNGWEVVNGPIFDEDEKKYVDFPDDDPMFLM